MLKEISIVIPFYNEGENIKFLVEHLSNSIKKEYSFEIIFVDDGSTDNSYELINKIDNVPFDYKVIKLSKNFGSHIAIRAGILNSSYNVCTFMGADLQEPFDDVYLMYEELSKGYDIVLGYKKNQNRSFLEKVLSNKYSNLMKKYAVKEYPKEGVNKIMFNSKIKEELNKNIEKNSSILLQILDFGFKQSSIPVSILERKAGKSKWTISKKIKLLIDSFVSYSYYPIRIVSLVGIIMFLIGIILAIVVLINKLFYDNIIISGYSSLIIVSLIGFGVTNISLGIIAEYLWRTLDESRKRPAFIVSEKIERRRKK